MPASLVTCRIEEFVWLTPTVMGIRFEPDRRFSFHAGQFISLVHPQKDDRGKLIRRAYSLASPSPKQGYELCVKKVDDGKVSAYLASLQKGDTFRAIAPYGDFHYASAPDRRVCFISTGSGIAPFRAMVRSEEFLSHPPRSAVCLFGARSVTEILYPGFFESLGIQTVHAISRPTPNFKGFTGRVTDYLKSIDGNFDWAGTDFYLCGNGDMVNEVRNFLISARQVSPNAIRQEIYFTPRDHLESQKKAA
jgi:ferredoxin-NADP reductase